MFYLVIGLFYCTFSCGKKEDKIYDDIELLKSNINLMQINPVSVKWIKTELGHNRSIAPGPKDYNLIAILTLSESEWLKLKKNYDAEKVKNNSIYLDKGFIKNWFTNSVKECFYLEEEYYRISCKSFSAKLFSKSPFVDGFVFFTNGNQVFIMLNTT